MADLRENELVQKKDVNFIRGLDAAENSVLISKENMAQVLTEFIPINTLENKGFLPANTFVKKTMYMRAGKPLDTGISTSDINGFIGLRNGQQWGGFEIYAVGRGAETNKKILAGQWGNRTELTAGENGNYVITNTEEIDVNVELVYFNFG